MTFIPLSYHKKGTSLCGKRPIFTAGTSSILAGALLAAVCRCTGRTYDTDSLIHAVLHLEQVLTTGKAVVICRRQQEELLANDCK